MNTAINSATERTNSTSALVRHGQKQGHAKHGKTESNSLFAEVLSASGGLPTDANTKASGSGTNVNRIAKKDIDTTATLFDAGMVAVNIPAIVSQSVLEAATTVTASGPTLDVSVVAVDTATPTSHKESPSDMAPTKGEVGKGDVGIGIDGEALQTTAPKNQPTFKEARTPESSQPEREPVTTVGKAVSAAAKTVGRVLPPPQALTQAMGLDAMTTHAWHMSIPGSPGNRLQAAAAEASPELALGSAVQSSPVGEGLSIGRNASQDASGGGKGDSGPPLLLDGSLHEPMGTGDADSNANPSFAASLGEAMGEAFQNMGTQVSYWVSQNVKRASINLDIGTDQTLQVEVTLEGDKAQLDFRTDDASARIALQNNAEQVLNDLLARSGLGLAGFSVGSQAHQSAQQNPHPSHNTQKALPNQFGNPSDAESLTVQRWTPRATSSVDIYA